MDTCAYCQCTIQSGEPRTVILGRHVHLSPDNCGQALGRVVLNTTNPTVELRLLKLEADIRRVVAALRESGVDI